MRIDSELTDAFGPRIVTISLLMLISAGLAAAQDTDIREMSLEELLNVEVYSASKFPQKSSDAPASVSIVTADDNASYGYTTLAQVLNGVRGLHVANDRNYDYLGVRGFGRGANSNNRFLLLVDGRRVNDTIYEHAPIGSDFLVDVDLIERVEIIRGPGSSIYGSNAFLGVINVITKSARDYGGVELSGLAASLGTYNGEVTYGHQFDNGAGLLLSNGENQGEGQRGFFYPALDAPEKNNGHVDGLDAGRNRNTLAKINYGGFDVLATYVDRGKEVPTASFVSVINQPHETTEEKFALTAGYRRSLDETTDVRGYAYFGRYAFTRESTYDRINEDAPPYTRNRDQALSKWWGSELELTKQLDRHHLVLGAQYQDDFRQDQRNYDVAPQEVYFDVAGSNSTWAVYAQNEVRLSRNLLINVGGRYDRYSRFGDKLSPRAAVIYSPADETTFKFLYGTAFRAPSEYELRGGPDRTPSPDLKPERITTHEAIVEHYLNPNMRIIATAYHNDLENLSELLLDPVADKLVFANSGQAQARGVELELESMFDGGHRLRVSYAWQKANDARPGKVVVNSPDSLAKLNFFAPLLADRIRLGLEVLYTGNQKAFLSDEGLFDFGETVVANLLRPDVGCSTLSTNLLRPDVGDR